MKDYVVMGDYGNEGWRIAGECDDFQEAVQLRESTMGRGTSVVIIFKTVRLKVTEE